MSDASAASFYKHYSEGKSSLWSEPLRNIYKKTFVGMI